MNSKYTSSSTLVTKLINKVQCFTAYRAPSHAISVDLIFWEIGTSGIMVPFFDKFLEALHSSSVDLPACTSLELLADTSPSGIPLWSTALSQGARVQNTATQ